MSNKTQLQTNNTSLDTLITRVNNAKQTASTLPEAAGGEQATPVISLNSSTGLITATAGTKSSTYQLAFQAAKTITPTTTSQTAVSSGYYTGGNVTVAAIPSSYVIPSGTKTITANGTYDVKSYASATVNISGGSGGNTDIEDAFVTRTLTSYENDRVATIGSYAFYSNSNLTLASFPLCTSIGDNAFQNCSNLTSISFPVCTSIGRSAFSRCSNLTSVNFPKCTNTGFYTFASCTNLISVNFPVCTSIGYYAFTGCTNLTLVSFPKCTTIGNNAFQYCSNLTSISFPLCTSISKSAFQNCSNLTSISFPNCTTISSYAFYHCESLILVNFPACTTIGSGAFTRCSKLTTIYLLASTICTLAHSNAFYSCSALTSIYVPTSLVSSYKAATNWTYFSSKIVGYGVPDEDDGPGKTISFYIDGTEHEAEQGMTWGEWVDSIYNIGGYYVGENNIISISAGLGSIYQLAYGSNLLGEQQFVYSEEEIYDGQTYHLVEYGNSGAPEAPDPY